MFEELQVYLKNVTSPENISIILNSLKVLEENGRTSIGDYLEEFMATIEERTSEENLIYLNDTLINQYEITLNEFGIFISEDEVQLKILVSILEGLNAIERTDNPIPILDKCQSDDDPEEILSEILEMYTNVTWDQYLLTITSVNPSLIEKIKTTLPDIEENDTVPKSEEFILLRIRNHLENNPNLWVLEEVDNGFLIGQKLDYYLNKFTEYFIEKEDLKDAKEIANQYLGFVLLSEIENEDFQNVVLEALEDIVDDVNLLSKISIEVISILTKVLK